MLRYNRQKTTRIAIDCKCTCEKEKEQKAKRNWGSVADWVGVAVNFGVGIITLFLFGQAFRQNKISEDNYNLAKITFDSTIAAGKADDVRADSALEVQKRSVDAQIRLVNEMRYQFKTINRPKIQLTELNIDTFDTYKPIQISFKIQNLGKETAKIISAASSIEYLNIGDSYNTDSLVEKIYNIQIENGESIQCNVRSRKPLSIIRNSFYKAGKLDVAIVVRLKFINPISGKKETNLFAYKVITYPINKFEKLSED